MGFNVSAKAPGKILWIGGYSVLERPNISYATTVNAYVSVNSRSIGGNAIELIAPQLKINAKGSIGADGRLSIEVPKELLLLKTAAELAMRYSAEQGMKLSGVSISTKSDDAFSYEIAGGRISKSGLGSSAALAVATVASVLKATGVDLEKEKVHKLAQAAHSLATGKVGSGFDVAAATYGSILYSRFSPEIITSLSADYSNADILQLVKRRWDYNVEEFPLPEGLHVAFANFIGKSMITAASVGGVFELKKTQPETYSEMIRALNDANLEAVWQLRQMAPGREDALSAFVKAFDNGRSITKQLGEMSNVEVEPDVCTELIEESKKNGALVAKLPGAGGRDAIAALSLSAADLSMVKDFWKTKQELKVIGIETSNKGVIL